MEFGFSLPGRGPLASIDVVLKLAEKADALRFDSLFVTDHVVHARRLGQVGVPVHRAAASFPAGSRRTTSSRWRPWPTSRTRPGGPGSASACSSCRTATRCSTAKMLATIDVLSNGRVILGAGVGWLREEFEALGAPPFEERGRVTEDYIKLMRTAWTTDPVSYEGKHYSVRDVHVLPKPVQRRGIPVWIGGHTGAALRRAGTIGDGWHPIAMRPPAMLGPDEYAREGARRSTTGRAARGATRSRSRSPFASRWKCAGATPSPRPATGRRSRAPRTRSPPTSAATRRSASRTSSSITPCRSSARCSRTWSASRATCGRSSREPAPAAAPPPRLSAGSKTSSKKKTAKRRA